MGIGVRVWSFAGPWTRAKPGFYYALRDFGWQTTSQVLDTGPQTGNGPGIGNMGLGCRACRTEPKQQHQFKMFECCTTLLASFAKGKLHSMCLVLPVSPAGNPFRPGHSELEWGPSLGIRVDEDEVDGHNHSSAQVIVSRNKRDSNADPKLLYTHPDYRYPQEDTPHFGKPPCKNDQRGPHGDLQLLILFFAIMLVTSVSKQAYLVPQFVFSILLGSPLGDSGYSSAISSCEKVGMCLPQPRPFIVRRSASSP